MTQLSENDSKPMSPEEEFGLLLAEYEENQPDIQEGEIIPGTIIDISGDFVVVDIGYKSEGEIPKSEFMDRDGNLLRPGSATSSSTRSCTRA
jgi:small subunit ribosomal protein S1